MSAPEATPLEELSHALPVDLGRSAAVEITQEMVDVHAGTTGDAQWIHNDPERALQMYGAQQFGHKIDPGMY